MTELVSGDKLYQDFTFSQRLEGVKPSELEEIAGQTCVQNLIDDMQKVTGAGLDSNYDFGNSLGVINSPRDERLKERIKEVSSNIGRQVNVKYIVHCGIGGSELGATMVISAVGKDDVEYIPIASLNNDYIARVIRKIKPKETVLIKATRSNTTKETLTAFDVFSRALEEELGQAYRLHCVSILGKEKESQAIEGGSHFVPIEPAMSGRYTGLHAANLFTMYLAGVDIDALHEGSRHMLKRCTRGRALEDNPALESAVYNYFMNTRRGKVVFNTGIFSPELGKYGDWQGQILEESLCHRDDIALITKTSELSDKAHSYFEGWLEGSNITYHQFVFPLGQNEMTVTNPRVVGETLQHIEFAEYKGITQALANAGRPSYTTFLRSVTEKTLGQLMMRDMIETMFLGELYGLGEEFINGKPERGYFFQPGVEAYKKIMRAQKVPQLSKELNELRGKFEGKVEV